MLRLHITNRLDFFLFFIICSCNALPFCTYRTVFFKAITLSGGSFENPPYFPESCLISAQNISSRIILPEFIDCMPFDTWGPRANNFPVEQIPDKCDSSLWQQARVLKVIDYIISLDLNYCHHHSPHWLPMDNPYFRNKIVDDKGICTDRGENGTNQWIGIDCSHFSSFTYNLALGTPFNTAVGSQACGEKAPGKVINITNDTVDANIELLKPGDLLFIESGGNISHVIMWTGYKLENNSGIFGMDNILKSYREGSSRDYYNRTVTKKMKNNETVYIVADSSYDGPNYRFFLGWLKNNLKHARRTINPEPNLLEDCLL